MKSTSSAASHSESQRHAGEARVATTTRATWREATANFAWLLLPLTCHFGFSWIGFNPTDDGWLQAVARRLAEGELPHRDFIFVRPALSAWFQVPIVWWGGEYVIWISRLWGWLSLACICWIWSGRVVARGSGEFPLVRYALYATALLLCAHSFPVMAWHSIDGMLLCTLAVVIAARETPGTFRAAFFVAGLSALCRQNFALFAPLLLVATGGRPRMWFVAGFYAALPSLIYFGLITAAGGGPDAVLQVWATSGAFKDVALLRFIKSPEFLVAIAIGAGTATLLLRRTAHWTVALPPVLLCVTGTVLVTALWRGPLPFHSASFALFGVCLGMAVPALRATGNNRRRLTHIAGLSLAWVTAISIGYNSPALMSGVLLLLLWGALHDLRPALFRSRAVMPALLVPLMAATALAFGHARQEFPYRDQPVAELRWDAGSQLAGARNLRTNSLTFATLTALRELTSKYESEGRPYAILTDCSAHWIGSKQRNLLLCDWPQETELGYSPALFRRFLEQLRNLPENTAVIVQKHLISDYNWRFATVPETWNYYFAQNWVRKEFRAVGENEFFTVYSPPPQKR